MKVFAVFSEHKAGLVKIWAESWRDHGWAPRLLSAEEVRRNGSVRAALRARGKGLLTDLLVLNFDYPVRNRPRRRVILHGKPGWDRARLVRFHEGATEDNIRTCGRELWD